MATSATYLVPILSSLAFGALSGATQPSNRNESFGFPASSAALNDFSNKLNNAYSGVNDYTKRDVSFPDATVQGLPTFSGGGLPMPIGTLAGPGMLSQPPSMPGIDFLSGPAGRHDFSNAGPGDPRGASGQPTSPSPGGITTPGGGDTSGGGGVHKAALPGGAQRQLFTDNSQPSAQPSVSGATPYAQLPYSTLGRSSTGQQNDPTHAALSLLYHAAGM